MVDIVNIFDVVNIVNIDHQHPSPGSKYAKDDIAHSVIPGLFFFIMISIHQFVKMILHTVNDEL